MTLAADIIRESGLPADLRAALELALEQWREDPEIVAACDRVRLSRPGADFRTGRRVRRWPPDVLRQVRERRAAGETWAMIGARFGVTAGAVRQSEEHARERGR